MNDFKQLTRDDEIRIAAADIVLRRQAFGPGMYTQLAGSPKPVDDFIKDCEVVRLWIHGTMPKDSKP